MRNAVSKEAVRSLLLVAVVTATVALFAHTADAQAAILGAVNSKVSVLNRLGTSAEGYQTQSCNALGNCLSNECSVPSCGNTFAPEKGFQCNAAFGTNPSMCGTDATCNGLIRSLSQSVVRFAPGSSFADKENQAFMCTMKSMDTEFKTELTNKEVGAWQYVANVKGTIRIYPGAPQDRTDSGCGSYDPRARPWYIAATSGPKDVVLVLDISGSMNNPNAGAGTTNPETRINALKKAVRSLLKTFTEVDYVSVVTFADSASVQGTPTPTTLLRASPANIAMLDDTVDYLLAEASSKTNMAPAFTKAFDVLAASTTRTTGCSRVILFLTDGIPSDGATVSESQTLVENAIATGQARMGTNKAHIFTYTFGDEANVDIPRAIACANRGVWSRIVSGTDPFTSMRGYYRFLALSIQSDDVRFTTPYEDSFGLGQMVTAAKPIFDRTTTGVPLLAAVVGVDIPMSELNPGGTYTTSQITAQLIAVGKVCPTVSFTDCQLQLLRQEEGFVCPGGQAVDTCPSGTFLESCGRPNLGSDSINTYLCESLTPTTRVSSSGTVKSDANVMCCGNCGGPGGNAGAQIEGEALSGGALAGIVIGGVVGLILIGAIAYCVVKPRPGRGTTGQASSSDAVAASSSAPAPAPPPPPPPQQQQQPPPFVPQPPPPQPQQVAPPSYAAPPPPLPPQTFSEPGGGDEAPPTYSQAVAGREAQGGDYGTDAV